MSTLHAICPKEAPGTRRKCQGKDFKATGETKVSREGGMEYVRLRCLKCGGVFWRKREDLPA